MTIFVNKSRHFFLKTLFSTNGVRLGLVVWCHVYPPGPCRSRERAGTRLARFRFLLKFRTLDLSLHPTRHRMSENPIFWVFLTNFLCFSSIFHRCSDTGSSVVRCGPMLHGSGVHDSTAERDLLERIKNNLTKIRHDRLSRKRPFDTLAEEFEALTERSSYPCGLQSGGGTHDSFSFVRLSRWLASWVGGLAVFTSVSRPPLLPPSLY